MSSAIYDAWGNIVNGSAAVSGTTVQGSTGGSVAPGYRWEVTLNGVKFWFIVNTVGSATNGVTPFSGNLVAEDSAGNWVDLSVAGVNAAGKTIYVTADHLVWDQNTGVLRTPAATDAIAAPATVGGGFNLQQTIFTVGNFPVKMWMALAGAGILGLMAMNG